MLGRKTAKSSHHRAIWLAAVAFAICGQGALGKSAEPAKSSPAAKPAEVDKATPSGPSDKVDISDIENKYWAPKDTDFSVVQNRTYTKEHRFAITGQYGPLINDSFSEGNSTSLNVNYFLSERWGIQLDYLTSDYRDTQATSEFKSLGGSPDYGRVTGYYGVGINWVPFYAKMSLLGSRIIYFDMAITPIVGMTSYEALTLDKGNFDKAGLTYGIDITQWFFIHKNFALRVDYKSHWFNETIVKYQTDGAATSGTKLRNKTTDNTMLLFGATVFF